MNSMMQFLSKKSSEVKCDSDTLLAAIECNLAEQAALLNAARGMPLSDQQIERARNALATYGVALKDFCRTGGAGLLPAPSILSADGEQLGIHIMEESTPWSKLQTATQNVPGMITNEESRYYKWLAKFYSGIGRVVELGPWLGSSTLSIVEGLQLNEAFQDQTLFVFDDFVWRQSWMNPYVEEADRLANHENFRHLFDRYTAYAASKLTVRQTRFAVYDGNESIEPLVWQHGDIEMLFVDCGRTIEANEGWYYALSPYFIPGKTIIVLQDWRLHREVPVKWFNQTELFTQSRGTEIQMIHELCDGGVATFLYLGTTN